MTNFKVGQKVVLVEDTTSTINKFKSGDTGIVLEFLDRMKISKLGAALRCKACGNSTELISVMFHARLIVCPCEIRPLSYSSNVNMEVISLFQPTEERQDLKPQPKKIEA